MIGCEELFLARGAAWKKQQYIYLEIEWTCGGYCPYQFVVTTAGSPDLELKKDGIEVLATKKCN